MRPKYGLKAIPLGGYISMAGMYAPVAEGGPGRTSTTAMFETVVQDDTEEDDLEGRTFFQLPVFKRVIIMLGGPVANLLIAIVLFGIVLMGYGTRSSRRRSSRSTSASSRPRARPPSARLTTRSPRRSPPGSSRATASWR